mgnify:CR=1 FL=1
MIQEKGSKTIEKKGGLKEIEIVSEEMAEDATRRLSLTSSIMATEVSKKILRK